MSREDLISGSLTSNHQVPTNQKNQRHPSFHPISQVDNLRSRSSPHDFRASHPHHIHITVWPDILPLIAGLPASATKQRGRICDKKHATLRFRCSKSKCLVYTFEPRIDEHMIDEGTSDDSSRRCLVPSAALYEQTTLVCLV